MDEEVAKVDTWVEGHQIHRGKEKAVTGLGSRQADQMGRGVRDRTDRRAWARRCYDYGMYGRFISAICEDERLDVVV